MSNTHHECTADFTSEIGTRWTFIGHPSMTIRDQPLSGSKYTIHRISVANAKRTNGKCGKWTVGYPMDVLWTMCAMTQQGLDPLVITDNHLEQINFLFCEKITKQNVWDWLNFARRKNWKLRLEFQNVDTEIKVYYETCLPSNVKNPMALMKGFMCKSCSVNNDTYNGGV
ncbi:hypothetical protein DAPPUDRAFT_321357 [Daphnia pulex]|uniref:Uncharacterized protein n=1 Tax=Daphnia pulex TaxID=6669 RepID=E9GSN6_DAPPU|nr:hypothetical protein DAPPUDRAFT_321357 [Daphnia pulex]|eukprot:EFX77549.1 hypothetical protein DAPPUDRAFT_321357 [Daphnia pulex]